MKTFAFLTTIGLVVITAVPAAATNTSSVFGPSVDPEDRSIEYRLGVDTDGGPGASFITSQRLHYQHSLSDRIRLRGIVSWDTDDGFGDIDFNYVQAEAMIQLSPERNGFVHGLRLDLRWRDHDRPGQLRANWTGQWDLGDGWRARINGLSSLQFANGADGDIGFEARGQLSRKVGGTRFGVESFADLGDTSDFSVFRNNETTIGPFVGFSQFPVPFSLGAQFGLTNSSPDTQLRLFVNYDLY